ncbi:Sterol 3-beta-glucosyltransferase UGT80A2 [Colletotrichum higginsianum]|uniref:Sterol 3-beta-glucosyltransferase UGT80A2 n=1 Tax=Colletotrichum higginsianum TaxID=80884 RepID=A0A4T0WI92_9PEZI|nr:Sterol 3-beta-glucosyltransferase UGT80A2 [Colletotrichum higginsianum]
MADKRKTIRYELPADDASYYHLAPSLPNTIRRAASTGDLTGQTLQHEQLSSAGDDSPSPPLSELWGDDTKILEEDGRVQVDCNSKLARAFSVMYRMSKAEKGDNQPPRTPSPSPSSPPPPYDGLRGGPAQKDPTRLNVVIQVVGSRGDVQPFVALGAELKRRGHRVRLATHDVFDKFVRDAGLEHYGVGGDPAALMAYMVKNPGLIPSMKSLKAGEIRQKREMVEEMLDGFWDACTRPDAATGRPFVADAIIANPPSFAHVHCAQALGIPVHLMFTMPWTSTAAFPHPLANLQNVGGDHAVANYVSYGVVEHLTWQGLGDVINKWRGRLDLEPVAMFDGPMLAEALKIPFTYCWSPALVPKPRDWGTHIDVCGFFFRDAPTYSPPEDLARFLAAGPPPVYIGFGSIVLDDPQRVVKTILGAVDAAGVRAIISKGWSDLAGSGSDTVYWIGDCPHEWLFQHVAAVVHHGGAGTTACGLRNGKPTTIVPFFGDQPFWGDMVADAGAGPRPIPHKQLTPEKLTAAIQYCLSDRAVAAAQGIAARMQSEGGVQAAADSWWKQLPLTRMQCDLVPSQAAAWSYTKSKVPMKLSKAAAEVLLLHEAVQQKHLSMHESKPITMDVTRWDPITGGASAVLATATDMTGSITGMVTRPMEEYKNEKRRRTREELRIRRQIDGGGGRSGDGSPRDSVSSTGRADGGSDPSEKQKRPSMAGKVAGASAKSIGLVGPTAAKGMLVDFPLALTEGLRAVPKHFGTAVRDHGAVTDARSGAVVAGKTFAWGFVDGLSDLVMEPVRGAGNGGGALGAFKGVGKGAASLVAKSGAGMFGLFAYPSAGIAKSLRSAVYSGTRKAIAKERHREGQWLVSGDDAAPALDLDAGEILAAFHRLRGSER